MNTYLQGNQTKYQNNFNFLRLFLAMMVILGHSFGLLDLHDKIPYLQLDGTDLGSMRVRGFFVMSGFLVHKSLERSNDLRSFFAKRWRRIYPALFVCCVFMVVCCSLVSTLPMKQYFSDHRTYAFFFGNSILWPWSKYLPGVFSHNPTSPAVNGSLWTLRYEVLFYVILACFYRFTRKQKLIGFGIWFLSMGTLALLLDAHYFTQTWMYSKHIFDFSNLSSHFAIGAILSLYDFSAPSFNKRCFIITLLLLGVCTYFKVTPIILTILSSLAVISFGHLYWAYLDISKYIGDISYGTYLYAYPIQQTLISQINISNPFLLFALSLPLSLLAGWLSWHLVEKRFLPQRK